jgi:sporulation protein YlmC with PRC-barrel domain
MPESLVFQLGSDVRCVDGDCGQVKSVVISPGDDAVTHLVVEPAHDQGLAKLVPLRLVDTAPSGEVRLRCTVAEYGQLDPAEATYSSPGVEGDPTYRAELMVSWPSYSPPGAMGMPGVMGMPAMPRDDVGEAVEIVTVDTVQDQLPGSDEVSPGEHVHAKDGDIGHVQGIVADPRTRRVTAVVLRERHLLSRRTVLIPRSAVAEVGADGFHLSISKRQVQDLPPADVGHPPASSGTRSRT